MTIKALRPVVVSANLSLSSGEVADDVPDHIAQALISMGKAVRFTRPAAVAVPVMETAAVAPVTETQATPKPRRIQARK
jgi:hypothetical protein